MPDKQVLSAHRKTGSVFLPDSFFTQVMPRIQNLVELKVVLCVAHMILRKQPPGTHRSEVSVTYSELKAEISRLLPDLSQEALRQALDSAVEHGALSRSTSNINEVFEDVYSLTIESGETPAANIFTLYEDNIGMLTPMISEELKEAENLYPINWIQDAIKEAVSLNKRNIRYIIRILENWSVEGRSDGTYKRDSKKDDPDKYIKKLEDSGIAVARIQTHCPVMGGKINKQHYADVKGKRIYVCCPGCIEKIESDPDTYISKLETSGVLLDETPADVQALRR